MNKNIIILLLYFIFSDNCNAFNDLDQMVVHDENNQINKLIDTIYTQICAQVYNEFNDVTISFVRKLQQIVDSRGKYSQQAEATFTMKAQKELQNSMNKIHKISADALQIYYKNMQQLGIIYSVSTTDPIAQNLQDEVHSIENDCIDEMQNAIFKLQCPIDLDEISNQVNFDMKNYEKNAQQEYAQQESKASAAKKTSWWQDLGASSTDVLGTVVSDVAAESKKILIKESMKAAQSVGKDVLKEAFKPSPAA